MTSTSEIAQNLLQFPTIWRDYWALPFLIPAILLFLYKVYRPTNVTGNQIRLPRPIPNSYWATPLVLACEYPFHPLQPDCPKLDALLRSGVRTFIDLTEEGELVPYFGPLFQRCTFLGIDDAEIEYHRFPIRDRCLPTSPELVCAILDTLNRNASRNRISAVHCRGGIGRTGTVVGCWLVNCGAARNGAQALSIIASEWESVEKCVRFPSSPETGPQCDFVYKYTRR